MHPLFSASATFCPPVLMTPPRNFHEYLSRGVYLPLVDLYRAVAVPPPMSVDSTAPVEFPDKPPFMNALMTVTIQFVNSSVWLRNGLWSLSKRPTANSTPVAVSIASCATVGILWSLVVTKYARRLSKTVSAQAGAPPGVESDFRD